MNESYLKAQVAAAQQKQSYGDTDQQGYSPQVVGGAMCADRAARMPLREQLEKRGAGIADQHGRIARALDILQRHPEFEEFLQLQELISSGLYY